MSKYSLVLEQIDNGVRETIRDANDIFDSELYVPLEKMRENPKFTYSGAGLNEALMLNSNYATIKNGAKMSYDYAIIKILQKQVECYKFIDNFKSNSMIDCLHFAKTMFSEDYKFLKSYIFSNNFLGQTNGNSMPYHKNASQFLFNIIQASLSHPNINTTRGEPQVKWDVPYLKNEFNNNRDTIIEIFEIIDLFVNERGRHKLTVAYLTPISSYNGEINTKFMAGFIQCFISFFDKMNKIEYNPVIPDKSVDHKEIDDFFKSLTKKQKPGGYNKRSMKKKVSK
jgi:hypothetical protein